MARWYRPACAANRESAGAPDRLRAVAPRIVQQDYAAIAALLFHALQDDVRARLRPILGIDVFQHHEITEVLRNLQGSQLADLGGLVSAA